MKKNNFLPIFLICSLVANSLMAQLTWKGTPPDPNLTTTGTWDLLIKSWTANDVDSTSWVNGGSATFSKELTSLKLNDAITCSSITANENVTLTSNVALIPLPTLDGVSGNCNITVANGKYFNFGNVSLITGTTFVKNGAGELVCTNIATTTSAAGYILNEGLFSIKGALTGAPITINGNCTLSSSSLRALSPSKLDVKSNFTIGVDSDSPSLNSLVVGGLLFSATTPVDLGGVMRTITIAGSNVGNAFLGVVSNGGITINGNSTNAIKLSAVNTYTLGTIINSGTLELRAAGALPTTGKITLNGGTLSGINFTQNCGPLVLTDNSTIILSGTGINLNFANSSTETWTAGKILTVTGWAGIPGAAGTGNTGKIKVGVGGLTAQQLAQINFAGTGYTGAVLTATGEVVPAATGTTPPNLVAQNTTTKVTDATFDITFLIDNADWRSKITSITLDGVTLPANAYNTTVEKKITIITSNCGTALQSTASKKTFVITATGYLNEIYSKTMISGEPTHLVVTTQPVAPLVNGGTIPAIKVSLKDMYENTCNATSYTNTIFAQPTQSTWTLGGTTSIACVRGEALITGLTVTSTEAVSDASITFTAAIGDGTLINVVSLPFAIPFLTGLRDVENASSVKIFANANKQITVVSENEKNGMINVYNTLGQKLLSTKSEGSITLLTNSFKSGVYIVSLNIGGKIVAKKVSIH